MSYRLTTLLCVTVSMLILSSGDAGAQTRLPSNQNLDDSRLPWQLEEASKAPHSAPLINSKYTIQGHNASHSIPAARFPRQDDKPTGLEQSLSVWPEKSIQDIRFDIRETSTKVPADRSSQLVDSSPGDWYSLAASPKVFAWTAPNIRYQPLYFEDVALERYGLSYGNRGRQLTATSLHFFVSTMTLPLQVRFDPIRSCDYPLGYSRPGSAAPCVRQKQLFWNR